VDGMLPQIPFSDDEVPQLNPSTNAKERS
jgi:hypothetical protein